MRFFGYVLVAVLCYSGIRAQECNDFLVRQYDTWSEMNEEYGTAVNYEGVNVSLAMNIFKPIGDGNTQRPLLVMVHGGGFHEGHRNDFNELCQWYAERGYVAATISYRLGLYHLISPIFAVDYHEMVRALYRGMQDTRGAIRFLKGRAELDSTDVSRVAVLGGSAGGIIALHTAYMDKPEEKPGSCNAISPVLLAPRPDLGPIEGTMNLNGFDTDVRAVVNIFGALRDTSLIESADDSPIYAYHQTMDGVVHCTKAKPYWALFPDTNNPLLDGSCVIESKTDALGFAPENAQYHYYEGTAHDVHDLDLIDAEIAEFLNYHMCSVVTGIDEEEQKIEVFPNPATDRLSVKSHERIDFLELYSVSGRLVAREAGNGQIASLDLSGFDEGIYLMKIGLGSQVVTEKIVVQ